MSVNFLVRQNGIVAILATLFMASYVKGDKCDLDFNNEDTIQFFDLSCNERSNIWSISNVNGKNALVLDPGKEGCVRLLMPVTLDSNSTLAIRYLYEGDQIGNLTVSLTPLFQKNSPDEKHCVWKVENHPEFKPGQWFIAEHKFSVPHQKYFVTIEADQNKDKLAVNQVAIYGQVSDECDSKGLPKYLPSMDWLQANGSSTGYVETVSRNLMLTSATVITLNNLLN